MKRLAALVIVCIAVIASAAFAEGRHRLVVVADDARIVHAIEAAVVPWDIEVVTTLEPAPANAASAALIAEHEHADAVTWTTPTAIWLYEARGPRLVSREIAPVAQYDEASAAAVALSLKTLLRMGSLSPDAPASAAPAASVAPQPLDAGMHVEPSPSAPPPRRMARGLTLEAELGARFAETDAQLVEPRLALAAGAWLEHLGLFLSLSAGPGSDVARAGLRGAFYDFGASLVVRAAFETGRFRWMPGAGIGAHVDWLSASIGNGAADVLRLDPSADVELFVAYTLGPRAFVGLRAGASFLLRRQEVFVNDVSAVRYAPAMVDVGLRAAYVFR